MKALKKKKNAVEIRARLAPAFTKFCMALEAGAGHRAALAATGLDWRVVSNTLLMDGEMAGQYDRALAARDRGRKQEIADETIRRALDGDDVPIVRGTEIIGMRKERSDRLLELLYRAHHPEQFISRVEADVDVGGLNNPWVQMLLHIEQGAAQAAARNANAGLLTEGDGDQGD